MNQPLQISEAAREVAQQIYLGTEMFLASRSWVEQKVQQAINAAKAEAYREAAAIAGNAVGHKGLHVGGNDCPGCKVRNEIFTLIPKE